MDSWSLDWWNTKSSTAEKLSLMQRWKRFSESDGRFIESQIKSNQHITFYREITISHVKANSWGLFKKSGRSIQFECGEIKSNLLCIHQTFAIIFVKQSKQNGAGCCPTTVQLHLLRLFYGSTITLVQSLATENMQTQDHMLLYGKHTHSCWLYLYNDFIHSPTSYLNH